jgi:antibiotic biosynthesis monooxygenase (ABM) superfamily enzyme
VTWRENLFLNFLIWLCVYPAVLTSTYVLDWLNLGLPLWLEIAISTALTVPIIGQIAAPQALRLVAKAEGRTAAELKLDDAKAQED